MTDYVTMTTTLTLVGARAVLDAAVGHAGRIGVPVCVAVADRAGELLAYARMDGAPKLSAKIAQDKAYSVTAFNGMATHEWWGVIGSDPALRNGIVHTDRLVVFGGGVPLYGAEELTGAVGVSGGSAEQDRQIAEVGSAALD